MNASAIDKFQDAIRAAGMTAPDTIEADGKLHRFAPNGTRGDDAGWYVLHDDGIPAGAYGNWRTSEFQSWRADIGRKLTRAEAAAHHAKVDAMRREREAEEIRQEADARQRAMVAWVEAKNCEMHPYLTRKGIAAHGTRLIGADLAMPLRDTEGVIHSLQTITPDGAKRFMPGGRVKGCYFSVGTLNGATALCICEGFATAASIHEATQHPVAVAFNAGNLLSVSQSLRKKYPDLKLIICADDDFRTEGNPGVTKATEAARAIGGLLAVPDFGTNRPEGATDFNDLAAHCGTEAVQRDTASARAPEEAKHTGNGSAPGSDSDTAWPQPEPLAVKVKAEPYPLDALPEIIRAAVEEVAGFVKAPLPLVVASALATLSLAIQAQVDAQRADKLSGPVALFLLTIADSGERKSTCDEFFTKPIREYEQAQAEAAKPHQKKYAAEFAAWKAEGEGIISAIREAAKGKRKGKSIDTLQAELIELENLKPEPLRVPKLMRGDDTPENLAWALATQWPSAGVVFAEAGLVLGSHGMGNDSIMRNLALLNILWDGGELSIGRRTSESFTVRGARFTLGLQVQEATLRSFFEKSGKLARGIGFFARFLVAWPESTQGLRPFTEAPKDWPHLAAFHKRIEAILDQAVPIDANGALTPLMLPMTADAKAAWVDYHNAIEGELASGGELYDVRDVASKSADNAARLAALFQRFDGDGDAIGADALQNASRITAWHLNEARRFFGELALPDELANAARLDSWLLEYCRRVRTHLVGKNHARQHGPLRDGVALDTAIRELADLDRVRLVKDGKRLTIHVNPKLLGFAATVIDAGLDSKTA